MKFTILGCGTSTGVPIPACSCEVCESTDPKNHRTRTSGLLTTDLGENILIDTSPDLRFQALKASIKSIAAVLYTHAHADHILGLEDLRGYNFILRKAIPCYGTTKTLNAIKRMFWYIAEPPADYQGGLLAQLDFHEIEENTAIEIEGIEILPLLVWHGQYPVTAYKIGPLVYATDCKTIPETSKAAMQNCEYLIIDGLRYKDHPTHFTIDEAVAMAQELNAKQSYLIHMSHDVEYHTTNANLPSNVQLAYDGLTIDL